MANVDSIYRIEFFHGVSSSEGQYVFELREKVSDQFVCRGRSDVPGRGWQWVKCSTFTGNLRFTKGKEYLLKVSHSSGDSVNFVYRTDNPYPKYGQIEVGGGGWGQSESVENCDLVGRIVGQMDVVDSTYWGVNPGFPADKNNATLKSNWASHACSLGFRHVRFGPAWRWVYPRPGEFDFAGYDTEYCYIESLGCEILGLLFTCQCSSWASSYFDSIRIQGQTVDTFWSATCPPRNLYADIDSDTNYWARYVESVVGHYSDIHTWEVWNEINDTCTSAVLGVKGWWKRPNVFYDTLSVGLRPLCRLYLRLCVVADSIIRHRVGGHEDDMVIVGSLHQVNKEWPEGGLVSGKAFLGTLFDIALQEQQLGVFWDGVSVHPYQYGQPFNPVRFKADAETLRRIMRQNDDYGQLWITELGWHLDTLDLENSRIRQANGACEAYVSAKASEAIPAGGYDRLCWYSFGDCGTGADSAGLITDSFRVRRKSFYSYQQTCNQLTGKRLNRRVLLGDDDDEDVRIYEFEDPDDGERMWVCWKNGGAGGGAVPVAIPVRSDELAAERLAYGAEVPSFGAAPDDDGWLRLELTERPVFVWETGPAERPDLVVDEVEVVPTEPLAGGSLTIRARVRNIGNRATAAGSPTEVRFMLNGDSVGIDGSFQTVEPGETLEFEMVLAPVPSAASGPGLVSVMVNPDRHCVELETGNNVGYFRVLVR